MRYVKASELKSFAFCERAWFLERAGLPSALERERERGVSDHREHGVATRRASSNARLSSTLFALGLAGIVAALLWWFLR